MSKSLCVIKIFNNNDNINVNNNLKKGVVVNYWLNDSVFGIVKIHVIKKISYELDS